MYRFNTKYCDLFEETADWKCITTNGYIKKDGSGVMGAGVAKQAKEKFPEIDKQLGENLKRYGNVPSFLAIDGESEGRLEYYISFPVKDNWYEKAETSLIRLSLAKLHKMWTDAIFLSNKEHKPTILLPKPGCGNGNLSWESVSKTMNEELRYLGIDYWHELTVIDL